MSSAQGSPSHSEIDRSGNSHEYSGSTKAAHIHIFKSSPKGTREFARTDVSPPRGMSRPAVAEANKLLQLLKSKTVKSEASPKEPERRPITVNTDPVPGDPSRQPKGIEKVESTGSFHDRVSRWVLLPASSKTPKSSPKEPPLPTQLPADTPASVSHTAQTSRNFNLAAMKGSSSPRRSTAPHTGFDQPTTMVTPVASRSAPTNNTNTPSSEIHRNPSTGPIVQEMIRLSPQLHAVSKSPPQASKNSLHASPVEQVTKLYSSSETLPLGDCTTAKRGIEAEQRSQRDETSLTSGCRTPENQMALSPRRHDLVALPKPAAPFSEGTAKSKAPEAPVTSRSTEPETYKEDPKLTTEAQKPASQQNVAQIRSENTENFGNGLGEAVMTENTHNPSGEQKSPKSTVELVQGTNGTWEPRPAHGLLMRDPQTGSAFIQPHVPAPQAQNFALNVRKLPEAGVRQGRDLTITEEQTLVRNQLAASSTSKPRRQVNLPTSSAVRYHPQVDAVANTVFSKKTAASSQPIPVRPSDLGDQFLVGDKSELFEALHPKATAFSRTGAASSQNQKSASSGSTSPSWSLWKSSPQGSIVMESRKKADNRVSVTNDTSGGSSIVTVSSLPPNGQDKLYKLNELSSDHHSAHIPANRTHYFSSSQTAPKYANMPSAAVPARPYSSPIIQSVPLNGGVLTGGSQEAGLHGTSSQWQQQESLFRPNSAGYSHALPNIGNSTKAPGQETNGKDKHFSGHDETASTNSHATQSLPSIPPGDRLSVAKSMSGASNHVNPNDQVALIIDQATSDEDNNTSGQVEGGSTGLPIAQPISSPRSSDTTKTSTSTMKQAPLSHSNDQANSESARSPLKSSPPEGKRLSSDLSIDERPRKKSLISQIAEKQNAKGEESVDLRDSVNNSKLLKSANPSPSSDRSHTVNSEVSSSKQYPVSARTNRYYRSSPRSQESVKDSKVKLRSVKDVPSINSPVPDMKRLKEVVIGTALPDRKESRATEGLFLNQPFAENDEAIAPLLQRASGPEIANVSSGDSGGNSSDISEPLTKAVVRNALKSKHEEFKVKAGDSVSGKLFFESPTSDSNKDPLLKSIERSVDAASLDANATIPSGTLTYPTNADEDRKKIERLVARQIAGEIATMKGLNKMMLVKLILSGVIRCSPLKSGRLVTSSNDICNRTNYEETSALYLQHLPKRARLEIVAFDRAQIPILEKEATMLDKSTEESFKNGLRDACFFFERGPVDHTDLNKEKVVNERVMKLKDLLSQFGCVTSDTKSPYVNVIVLANDFTDRVNYGGSLGSSHSQVWSYDYAVRLFALLTSSGNSPTDRGGLSGKVISPVFTSTEGSENRSKSRKIQTESSAKVTSSKYVKSNPKSALKGSHRAPVLEARFPDSDDELIVERASSVAANTFGLVDQGPHISKDLRLRTLASEVIEDQFKLASLQGQLSTKDKEIAHLTSRLKNEQFRVEQWQHMLDMISEAQDGQNRPQARGQPNTEPQNGILDESVVENIHVIKNALHSRPASMPGLGEISVAAKSSPLSSSSSTHPVPTKQNDHVSKSERTGLRAATDQSPQSPQSDELLLTRFVNVSKELATSMASEQELRKLVNDLKNERTTLENSLTTKIQQMENDKKEADKELAASQQVINVQRQTIAFLKEQVKRERQERKAIGASLQALISHQDAGEEEPG
ncbi:chromatin-silencing protein SIR4 LALA0_S04e05776g [Lachancea lanzarotensis]|uniref:LALA0S04e05776g1_1 n=1 Tax=Lachancea lanzarotensis TaxID=1245769 RepID=A0A0C7N9D7_9SACH|nr:uncharacterized protein LALA0_S04e05776g [Lachancea lanzarotensis]CEP62013.1 LALA0S04e05776g1_1 [Lachancea lanzarotensis]